MEIDAIREVNLIHGKPAALTTNYGCSLPMLAPPSDSNPRYSVFYNTVRRTGAAQILAKERALEEKIFEAYERYEREGRS